MNQERKSKEKRTCVIAYANYQYDARVHREAEAIASLQGQNVQVISLKTGDAPTKYSLEGVTVKEINLKKYVGKNHLRYVLSYLKFSILAFFACTKLFIKEGIDIIHVHNMPNFIVFSAALPKIFGCNIILDVHDTMLETFTAKYDEEKGGLFKKLLFLEERLSCNFADRIICVNDIQRSVLVERGISNSKITTVLNVPDNKVFDYEKVDFPKPANGVFKVVYHGTITKRLGVDLAIRAVSELKGLIPELDFLILGNGDGKNEFKALVRALKCDDFIHFKEWVGIKDMISILVDKDLEIIANRKNIATDLMLPVKMLECVALGIPVVAPRLKTIEHYFSEDMVFYFDPDDIDTLAGVIYDAYLNRDKRVNKAVKAKEFLERYGWHKHKQDLINMYREINNKRRGRWIRQNSR